MTVRSAIPSHRLPLPPASRVSHAACAELELLQQVVFVEPDDQSAWMYHWWVLNWARRGERTPGTAAFGSASQEEREGLVGKVADTCRSLLEAEPTCKCESLRTLRWRRWAARR